MKFILCKIIDFKLVSFGKTYDVDTAKAWMALDSHCITITVKP